MPAIEIAAALQKHDRQTPQEAGECVRYREWRKYKEAVCRDALQRIHLQMLISAAEFHLVCAAHPAQRAGIIKGVFVGIAWAGDRIAN